MLRSDLTQQQYLALCQLLNRIKLVFSQLGVLFMDPLKLNLGHISNLDQLLIPLGALFDLILGMLDRGILATKVIHLLALEKHLSFYLGVFHMIAILELGDVSIVFGALFAFIKKTHDAEIFGRLLNWQDRKAKHQVGLRRWQEEGLAGFGKRIHRGLAKLG